MRLREDCEAKLLEPLAKGAPPRLGIIGKSGCGKSSLINAVVGRSLSEVGVTETTQTPVRHVVTSSGFELVDLSGGGARRWLVGTYAQRLRLREGCDARLFVNSGRISEDDLTLYRSLRAAKVPLLAVRTLFDPR